MGTLHFWQKRYCDFNGRFSWRNLAFVFGRSEDYDSIEFQQAYSAIPTRPLRVAVRPCALVNSPHLTLLSKGQ